MSGGHERRSADGEGGGEQAGSKDESAEAEQGGEQDMMRVTSQTRNALKAFAWSVAIALVCVFAYQYGSLSLRYGAAQRDLAATRSRQARWLAAIKFFELQSTMGQADYGNSPALIMSRDPEIQALGKRLKTPTAAFDYVARRISYERVTAPQGRFARAVLDRRMGNCQGQANLLASLLRAQGMSSSDVRIIYGHVRKDGMPSSHAWVEARQGTDWLVMDPTPFLSTGPGIWKRDAFYTQHGVVPVVVYNDENVGFGIE